MLDESWAPKCMVPHSVLILTTIDRATTTEDVPSCLHYVVLEYQNHDLCMSFS